MVTRIIRNIKNNWLLEKKVVYEDFIRFKIDKTVGVEEILVSRFEKTLKSRNRKFWGVIISSHFFNVSILDTPPTTSRCNLFFWVLLKERKKILNFKWLSNPPTFLLLHWTFISSIFLFNLTIFFHEFSIVHQKFFFKTHHSENCSLFDLKSFQTLFFC